MLTYKFGQVDAEGLIKMIQNHPHEAHRHHITERSFTHTTPYSSRYASKQELSKFRIPHDGAPADAVHQMLKDELDLDGRPNLNLASFVGTYMEREAEALMIENLANNMLDADEYPAMMAMHARCVSIIANLWVHKRAKPQLDPLPLVLLRPFTSAVLP